MASTASSPEDPDDLAPRVSDRILSLGPLPADVARERARDLARRMASTSGSGRVATGRRSSEGQGAELRTVPRELRPVLRSWQRSERLGADPEGRAVLQESILPQSRLTETRERFEEQWRGTESILNDFAGLCTARDFVAVISDAQGVVTGTLGGGGFEADARRLRLIAGAVWDESVRGTNAIGTAIAEARPVSVHGSAHFAAVNQGLCCFAAPVRDHRGEIVGVLDATSAAECSRDFDARVVLAMARAVEEVLRARAYASAAGGLELIERLLEHTRGAAFLLERPGRIVRANKTARELIAGRDPTAILPSFGVLEEHARQGSGPLIVEPERPQDPEPAQPVEVRIEPLADDSGELLALLTFVRPIGRGGTTPRPNKRRERHTSGRAFDAIHGCDEGLEAARRTCTQLAASDLPILLLAETGSGKELFARAIHETSRRATGPFVPVNCGAIQPDLMLSELFGHGPGAFTGANPKGRDGLITRACGGTLFLDEVAEMSVDTQVALLRVLEDGSYRRVGEDQGRTADIRIVAATCRELDHLVESGRFRRDLYFRIGGARVALPALRDRTDLDELVDVLWAEIRTPAGRTPPGLSDPVRTRLRDHDWPGNVRELKSVLAYAGVLAADSEWVEPGHLPAHLQGGHSGSPTARESAQSNGRHAEDLGSIQRQAVLDAVRLSGGNISQAARTLGIARSTVYRLARRFGLDLKHPTD